MQSLIWFEINFSKEKKWKKQFFNFTIFKKKPREQ